MNKLELKIPYKEFIEKYKDFENQLSIHKDSGTELDEYQKEFERINKEVINFLGNSFTVEYNELWNGYREATGNKYFNAFGGNAKKTRQDVEKDIDQKVSTISYHIELLEISDTIKDKSTDLLKSRKVLSIKQKRDFVLIKLSKLHPNFYHSIAFIFEGNGLKKDRDDEPLHLAKQLESHGLVNILGALGGDSSAQITLDGIEYVQDLQEEAFGLYEVGEDLSDKERSELHNVFSDLKNEIQNDIRNQFKEQNDLMILSLNALYETINESLELIDSKLAKKTIRQAIIGKVFEKAGEEGLNTVMSLFWTKLKAKLNGEQIFLGAFDKAQKMIESQLGNL